MSKIVVVGEGMAELSQRGGDWQLRYGGDVLNTAIHLARHGHDVAFLTALGGDPFSDDLRAAWRAEGIDDTLILSDPVRTAGLYAIKTDADGERSFTYWRSDSAARQVFALPDSDRAVAAAAQADVLYFSLISLAILPPDGRAALLDLARRVRANGGRVAFDTNYRARLWPGPDAAQQARRDALAVTDIGLPTMEDEAMLTGAADASAVDGAWRAAGAGEIVVKLGGEGCVVDGMPVPPPARLSPVDTSGAGDAFNAGYLNGRLSGLMPTAAAIEGHRLAGWTIMHRGAAPARTGDAPYAFLA